MDKLSGTSQGEVIDSFDQAFNSDNADAGSDAAAPHGTQSPETADNSGNTDATITVAQAAQHVHVPTPPAGEQTSIAVVPGVEYDFDFAKGDADFVFSDGNLIILIHGGGEIILENFGSEAAGNNIPPLDFAGQTIGAFDLLSQTASAEQLADIQPAAGPGAGVALTGGAAFSPFDPNPLPPSIPPAPPILPTSLAFGGRPDHRPHLAGPR